MWASRSPCKGKWDRDSSLALNCLHLESPRMPSTHVATVAHMVRANLQEGLGAGRVGCTDSFFPSLFLMPQTQTLARRWRLGGPRPWPVQRVPGRSAWVHSSVSSGPTRADPGKAQRQNALESGLVPLPPADACYYPKGWHVDRGLLLSHHRAPLCRPVPPAQTLLGQRGGVSCVLGAAKRRPGDCFGEMLRSKYSGRPGRCLGKGMGPAHESSQACSSSCSHVLASAASPPHSV